MLDLNYGGAPTGETQKVLEGFTATRPETEPARPCYAFYDWYINKECTMPFDFDSYVPEDTTIYVSMERKRR